MATSGTFTGSREGGAFGPWLTLEWERIETDIVNNRSRILLTLRLHSDRNIVFSASKTGVIDGTSFTYTGNYNGPEVRTIKTKEVWVNHDSDGGRSEAFSAYLNIAITWSGVYISRLDVGGTANIDTIPRASDLTSFTLTNTVLTDDTHTTINYGIVRKSSSFTQAMTLKYGNKTIASWTINDSGALYRTLSVTEIKSILSAMSKDTDGFLQLYMQTKSGSTNIGDAQVIGEYISISSSVAPVASGLTTAIAGTGRDKTIGQYVQSISKVTASFTRTAGYGATVTSSTITVKKLDGGGNSQTIPSNSGTTPNAVSLSGTYQVTAKVVDSRGRSHTTSVTIPVQTYAAPRINTFTVKRTTLNTSIVSAVINATWSALGTSNPTTVKLESVDNASAVKVLYTLANSTAGSLSATQSHSGQTDASSFLYILSLTDSFGKQSRAEVTVGTSFVEVTIAKGLGVGVAKVHERGALDVGGDTYIKGAGPYGWHFDVSTGYLLPTRYKYENGYNMLGVRDGNGVTDDTFLICNISTTVTMSGTSGYADVTFPAFFDSAPLWIIAQPVNVISLNYTAAIYSPTTTGCRVYLVHVAGVSGTSTVGVNVIACGRKVSQSS